MNNIHRLNFCGVEKNPVVCIECAYDAAVLEDAERSKK